MINRRIDDRGGGLARVNGRPRLVEGLAMPREEAEFDLSYYNTLTTWIDVDKLLTAFGLTKSDLADDAKVTAAVRDGRAHADVRHAEGREEALGPRAGRRFPRCEVREDLGRLGA